MATKEELQERYQRAAHAMQSALAAEISATGLDTSAASPKHLRVGINSAFAALDAIQSLLIQAGVVTEEQVFEANTIAMEKEADRCAEITKRKLGLPANTRFG
jgi:hypothetical protein